MLSVRINIQQGLLAIGAVIINLIATTQWAAAMLWHQPAFGVPWTEFLRLKICAPWRLFSSWLAFDAQAPANFSRARILAALGEVGDGLAAFGGAARQTNRGVRPATYGSARWAHASDVATAVPHGGRGIVHGIHQGRHLSHDSAAHVLAVAPTRLSKDVNPVVPALLTWMGAAIAHDVKGGSWSLAAGGRAEFFHSLMLDLTNPNSARFNPLLEVRNGAHEVRDFQNVADVLVERARRQRYHWEKTAHALLTGAIVRLLYAEQEKTPVATFFADPSHSITRTLRIMLSPNHLGNRRGAARPFRCCVHCPGAPPQVRQRALRCELHGRLPRPLPRSTDRCQHLALRLAHRRCSCRQTG